MTNKKKRAGVSRVAGCSGWGWLEWVGRPAWACGVARRFEREDGRVCEPRWGAGGFAGK